MKDYIKGKIISIDNDQIVIENNEIGYRFEFVNIDEEILKINQSKTIYLATIVSDFEQSDYGFIHIEQRNMFADLIKIKTVGPKTALTILQVFGYDQFKEIVEQNDIDKILDIKGIGVFTARLIINELAKTYFDIKLTQKQEKVINSLVRLGFKSKDIYLALKQVKQSEDIETMTQQTLQIMNQEGINNEPSRL